jgi:hypothetical protein
MVDRRLSTIAAWMTKIGMLQERNRRYFLQDLPEGVDMVDFNTPEEPLCPRTHQLEEYQEVAHRVRQQAKNMSVMVNQVAKERANDSHRMLTSLVASRVRSAGGIPKRNNIIDLSTELSGQIYLFEMKSTTESNAHAQIRRAISQLYEYRYMYTMWSAKLVIVIEQPPPRDLQWIVDYVVADRKLLLAWDGDRTTLHYPDALREQLQFMA